MEVKSENVRREKRKEEGKRGERRKAREER